MSISDKKEKSLLINPFVNSDKWILGFVLMPLDIERGIECW
jgi:hypothetical protein